MKHPTYCSFPFNSIAPKSWRDGKPHRVTPCCNMKGSSDDPMGVKHLIDKGYSLEQIFLSEEFDRLRKDLLSGIKNSACDYCWKLENKTNNSPRLTAIENLKMNQNSMLVSPVLKKLDTMVDENCNLRCRMCAPGVSNSLRQDFNQVLELNLPMPEYYNTNKKESQADPFGNKTFFGIGEEYKNEIIKLSSQLEELKFTGGEPTTSPIFWEIIDSIKEKNDIKLHLTTNGTKFNEKFLDTVSEFGSRHFTLSIDATRSTYEYMRYPFNWRKLETNIEKLCETQNPETTEIHICSVLTIYNMINIRNLVDWIHHNNWHNNHKITWKCIPDPHPINSCLDVKWASKELLEISKMNMTAALEESTHHTKPAIMKTINYLSNCLDSELDEKIVVQKRHQLKTDTMTLDKVRNHNYEEILYPQIADFISSIQIQN